MTWNVIKESHHITDTSMSKEKVGLKNFETDDYNRETVIAELFLHLSPTDWGHDLEEINKAIERHNLRIESNQREIRWF